MSTSDIGINNLDIPFLAEFIYKMYPYDALNFEIDAIQRTIEFLPQLYPEAGSLEREKMIQILRLQTAIKFCQYAENLAAIAIAFQSSYDDEKQECTKAISYKFRNSSHNVAIFLVKRLKGDIIVFLSLY